MPFTPIYLYGLAAAVYVTTCLMAAAVRWFHMCKPYSHNPEYYYPSRPYVVAAWISSLFLLPYVLNPASADAWFVARLYFLPVTIYHFTLLLFSYFGSVMQWKKWQWPTLLSGVPVAVTLLAAVVVAILPGDQLGGTTLSNYIVYILGLLITGVCFVSLAVVWIWVGRYDNDEFSNPTDFPVTQARRWIAIILFNTALCWVGALFDSPAVLAVIQLLIAVSCVVFVISVLHPNRNLPVEEAKEDAADQEAEPRTQVYLRSLSKQRQAEILAAVITVVEEQEAYLDPHLTLQDVADRCGYNRTYISGLVKSELGGFFAYVNRLRMTHAERLLAENPGMPVREAIDASGFGSSTSYYKIKHQLGS